MNKFSIGTLIAGLGASAAMLASPAAMARDHVNWSVNIGAPAVAYPAYAAPVYSGPPVVYAQPQPVYVEPAPVYYSAPRVYVAPAPVYRQVYYGVDGRPVYWERGHHGRWHHWR